MKIITMLLFMMSVSSFADQGVVHIASQFNVKQTADRLETLLKKKGMKVFSRLNHANGAKGVGIELNPTELIIFGNPKVGSPLIQCQQTIALDLPQKALIWQDENGKVWLSYNDPEYLKKRHKVTGCDMNFAKITKALAGIAKAAAVDDLIIQLN